MRKYLQKQLVDAGVIEVRHISDLGHRTIVESGRFDDADKLVDALGNRKDIGNLYVTLNRPFMREAENEFGTRAFSDNNIRQIVRLPFDFDPIRPTGRASTDDELSFSEERARGLLDMLRGMGWALPLYGWSGNGHHLQYRVDLPANDETKEMLTVIYRGLAQQLSDDVVDFDVKVRNPSRILRLYATMNRKGISTAERPWRKSTCRLPKQWDLVTRQQVESLAESFTRKAATAPRSTGHLSGKGDYSTLDVVSWFQSHGLYKHHISGNKHSVSCPWAHEHSQNNFNDSIVFEADGGWPGFYCHHSHCEGRNIRDVIRLYGDADTFCTSKFSNQA